MIASNKYVATASIGEAGHLLVNLIPKRATIDRLVRHEIAVAGYGKFTVSEKVQEQILADKGGLSCLSRYLSATTHSPMPTSTPAVSSAWTNGGRKNLPTGEHRVSLAIRAFRSARVLPRTHTRTCQVAGHRDCASVESSAIEVNYDRDDASEFLNSLLSHE